MGCIDFTKKYHTSKIAVEGCYAQSEPNSITEFGLVIIPSFIGGPIPR